MIFETDLPSAVCSIVEVTFNITVLLLSSVRLVEPSSTPGGFGIRTGLLFSPDGLDESSFDPGCVGPTTVAAGLALTSLELALSNPGFTAT
ncbi:hypothetical protein D3C81_1091360 [compost metagenome]